ncbi:MAG: outer membrane beta-barrel protein [Sphingomonas sp.]|jgi:outer membrane immunogenic protein|uniref:outer membrane protein n=1 Tax=Sphingomonas sp. TaxID=28214 RepID=UPI003569817A
MRLFAAAITLSGFVAGPALAQDKPFEGASVTVIGGVEVSQSFGDAKVGALYGGQLGYDWQSDHIVFGLEGEVTGATATDCTTYYYPGGANARSCEKPGRDLYVGGRVGTVLGESTLLYAKGGYTNLRRAFDYTSGGSGPASYSGSGTTDGFRVGLGVEKRLESGLTLKTEYRYSNHEGPYSSHQAVVGLGYRF